MVDLKEAKHRFAHPKEGLGGLNRLLDGNTMLTTWKRCMLG